jgi:hypothetical protein
MNGSAPEERHRIENSLYAAPSGTAHLLRYRCYKDFAPTTELGRLSGDRLCAGIEDDDEYEDEGNGQPLRLLTYRVFVAHSVTGVTERNSGCVRDLRFLAFFAVQSACQARQ